MAGAGTAETCESSTSSNTSCSVEHKKAAGKRPSSIYSVVGLRYLLTVAPKGSSTLIVALGEPPAGYL